MNFVSLRLPKNLTTLRAADSIFNDHVSFDSTTTLEVDPIWCSTYEPLPLIYLAFRLKKIRQLHPNITWKLRRPRVSSRGFFSYAHRIGFLKLIGFDIETPSTTERGDSSTFPIRSWSIPNLLESAGESPIGQIVDDESALIAETLLQKGAGELYDVVQFSMREIARNAFEHSRGNNALFLGHYSPKSGIAQIVIADDGVGIATSLYDNEYVDIANNLAGLQFSLLPGVTGVPLATRAAQDDKWHNSGFGLYMVSRISARYGDFHILSNNDYLRLRGGEQYRNKYNHKGTIVCVRLHVKSMGDFAEFHRRIVEEGEKMRSELIKEHPVRASAASKMLRSQFGKKLEGRNSLPNLL